MMKHGFRLLWVMMSVVLLSALFLLGMATPVRADPPDSWYVDPSGVDTSDCGAVSAPCQTLGYAISEAITGAVVIAAPGVYTENITIDKRLGSCR